MKAHALVPHASASALTSLGVFEANFPEFHQVEHCGLEHSWIATFATGVIGVAYLEIADDVPELFWGAVQEIIHENLSRWDKRLSEELFPFFLSTATRDIMAKDLSPDRVLGQWIWEIIGLTDEADKTVAAMARDPEWHSRTGRLMISSGHHYWR